MSRKLTSRPMCLEAIRWTLTCLLAREGCGGGTSESNKSNERAWHDRDGNCTCQTLFRRSALFLVFNYVALELRAPLSRDKRQATDDSTKKATAASDPVARRPFRMIARFYVFISGESRRTAFHRADVSLFSIANRNSFRSLLCICAEREACF